VARAHTRTHTHVNTYFEIGDLAGGIIIEGLFYLYEEVSLRGPLGYMYIHVYTCIHVYVLYTCHVLICYTFTCIYMHVCTTYLFTYISFRSCRCTIHVHACICIYVLRTYVCIYRLYLLGGVGESMIRIFSNIIRIIRIKLLNIRNIIRIIRYIEYVNSAI